MGSKEVRCQDQSSWCAKIIAPEIASPSGGLKQRRTLGVSQASMAFAKPPISATRGAPLSVSTRTRSSICFAPVVPLDRLDPHGASREVQSLRNRLRWRDPSRRPPRKGRHGNAQESRLSIGLLLRGHRARAEPILSRAIRDQRHSLRPKSGSHSLRHTNHGP
jgi:hypothetical protein